MIYDAFNCAFLLIYWTLHFYLFVCCCCCCLKLQFLFWLLFFHFAYLSHPYCWFPHFADVFLEVIDFPSRFYILSAFLFVSFLESLVIFTSKLLTSLSNILHISVSLSIVVEELWVLEESRIIIFICILHFNFWVYLGMFVAAFIEEPNLEYISEYRKQIAGTTSNHTLKMD